MSLVLVQQYLTEINKLRRFSGLSNEQVIRAAFRKLLDGWASGKRLILLEEYPFSTALKTTVYPDATILYDIRVPLGYWEAKDTADDLDVEIAKKFKRGYPQDNILFENSETAALIQNRQEIMRCSMTKISDLSRLLELFFSYERPEIAEFRRAIEKFKLDLPVVLEALREKIDAAYTFNDEFRAAADEFLVHAKATINPALMEADVREMLIQHVLTEDIFANVFSNSDFHRENNIAKALYALEAKFFTGSVKRETLRSLNVYYSAIRANAARISSHHEKQAFLKVVYENFYKIYNPKTADRLGVVYTPNEIVRFMIEGADWLVHNHFGKTLLDRDVEIMDPATGTGTFICELIEYFGADKERLAYKYKNEMHANEVAILPYYVANLNIEATFYGMTGRYDEFESLCFIDTLDNTSGLGVRTGQHVGDLFGAISSENIERVRRQNSRKISVVIGNPPYNANQLNENEQNKNRKYPHIDRLIKASYVRESNAQKTKVYDMYARFFRWASDRLHDDGVLAFVTNRSFLEKSTYDGFRKCAEREFSEIYIIDLGGDVRENRKLSGTKHNVFGIQIGVAISFMVKRRKHHGCKIFYSRRPEFDTARDKLAFLATTKASEIAYQRITPDADFNWINHPDSDEAGASDGALWSGFLPLANKVVKRGKRRAGERAVFRLYSLGVATNRDAWVYDFDRQRVADKARLFIDTYNAEVDRWVAAGRPEEVGEWVDRSIKWTAELEERLKSERRLSFNEDRIRVSAFRPFTDAFTYYDNAITHRLYRQDEIFPVNSMAPNPTIVFTGPAAQKPWMCLAVDKLPDLHFVGAAAGAVCLPRYRYDGDKRIDNITDWALRQFRDRYGDCGERGAVTRDDIFVYTYAVLNDPRFRATYAKRLKRKLPSIPLHPAFWKWRDLGSSLLRLHLEFESAEPPEDLRRVNAEIADGEVPRPMLRGDRETRRIVLDTQTSIEGLPDEAWAYELGSYSAIGWVLDQAKEKAPKEVILASRFGKSAFASRKERVAGLVGKVATVSRETVRILSAIEQLEWADAPADDDGEMGSAELLGEEA